MNRKLVVFASIIAAAIFCLSCRGGETIEAENDNIVSKVITELNMQGSENVDIDEIISHSSLKELNLLDTDVFYDDIERIKLNIPECNILFDAELYGAKYRSDIVSIDLSDEQIDEIDDLIYKTGFFDSLEEVIFCSSNIDLDDYNRFADVYTDIDIHININLEGSLYTSKDDIIDLSKSDAINIESLVYTLGYFDDIKQVNFGDALLEHDEMIKLMDACPNTEFLWNVSFLGDMITPEQTQIDISGTEIDDFDAFNNTLRFLPNIEYIEMINCGLSNENMDELKSNYPQKKFVWLIRIGNYEMRTDVKAFSTGNFTSFEGGVYLGGGRQLGNEEAALLKYCTDLIALDVGHQVNLTEFDFLNYLPNLQYLIVAITGITDLAPLTAMEDLMYLEIFTTDVSDLSPLRELENLKHFNCSLTLVDDIEVLMGLTQLERLWIVESQFTDEQIAELCNALPDTTVVSSASNPTRGGWRAEGTQVYMDMQKLFGLPPYFSD